LRSGLGTKRWFSSHGAQCASCRHYFIPTTRWPHDSTPATTCLIDGEAVACTETGLAEFDALRGRRGDVHLYAFDILELDGATCA
jgi:ATP-dependent DNA ligase